MMNNASCFEWWRAYGTVWLFVGGAIGLAGGGNIAVPQAIWHLISNWGAIHLGDRCESVRCIGQALLKESQERKCFRLSLAMQHRTKVAVAYHIIWWPICCIQGSNVQQTYQKKLSPLTSKVLWLVSFKGVVCCQYDISSNMQSTHCCDVMCMAVTLTSTKSPPHG